MSGSYCTLPKGHEFYSLMVVLQIFIFFFEIFFFLQKTFVLQVYTLLSYSSHLCLFCMWDFISSIYIYIYSQHSLWKILKLNIYIYIQGLLYTIYSYISFIKRENSWIDGWILQILEKCTYFLTKKEIWKISLNEMH